MVGGWGGRPARRRLLVVTRPAGGGGGGGGQREIRESGKETCAMRDCLPYPKYNIAWTVPIKELQN